MQYKWIALSVTIIGTLMAGIDTRIIIVGLPTVARELGADVESIIWVSQSYLLASTVGLLLIGRITDVVGRVKIYNIGFAVFTVGSFLAYPGEHFKLLFGSSHSVDIAGCGQRHVCCAQY
jgi:MFS family permease